MKKSKIIISIMMICILFFVFSACKTEKTEDATVKAEIGDIVTVKGNDKDLLLIAKDNYNYQDSNYDCVGIPYPEGLQNRSAYVFFNDENIMNIIFSIKKTTKTVSDDKKYYLPIGTVVKTKNSEGYVMIVGLAQKMIVNSQEMYFDYSAVRYPAGLMYMGDTYVLNNGDIEEIITYGYDTETYREYASVLDELRIKNSN